MIFLNLKDSAVTLLIIFIYTVYFAFFGNFLFFSSFEGLTVFGNFGDSLWEFTVLLTTENFPDVMLLSYQANLFSAFIFIIFIVIGIFYLLSILLSVVFEKYKKRVEKIGRQKLEQRLTYIRILFDSHDTDGLGYLTYSQARNFFAQVLELNTKKPNHRRTFYRILKICDPECYRILLKERVVDFFAISGFKIINELDMEQKRLKRALTSRETQEVRTSSSD